MTLPPLQRRRPHTSAKCTATGRARRMPATSWIKLLEIPPQDDLHIRGGGAIHHCHQQQQKRSDIKKKRKKSSSDGEHCRKHHSLQGYMNQPFLMHLDFLFVVLLLAPRNFGGTCSCGGLGGGEAAGDRAGGGGATQGHGGQGQDQVHLPLSHRCLLLGSQGMPSPSPPLSHHPVHRLCCDPIRFLLTMTESCSSLVYYMIE